LGAALLLTTGNAIRAATFPTLPNLKARWLGAAGALEADTSTAEDGDFVITWQDQSGNGNHAISSGGAFFSPKWVQSNPDFNNQPTLRFAGLANHTLQTLEAPNLNITGTALSLFVVLKHAHNTGEQGYVANYTGGNGFYLGETPTGSDRFIFFEGNNPGSNFAFAQGPIGSSFNAVSRARILNAMVDATTTSLYMNRILQGSTTSQAIGNSGQPFQIGWSNGFNEVFVGDMAEILVYDRALSASEIHSVTTYLEESYGIPEPGSLAAFAVAGLLLVRRHRRCR
jgi:hypothetical protein